MLWIQHFELNIIKYSFYYIWRLWFSIILLNICCINMENSRQIRVWYHEFIMCSQVVLSNCLNKFDVELSFLNDLRFSLISNLFLDLHSLFRNLFKLQLSMLSIYIFEFVAYLCIFFITFGSCDFMWLINYLSVIASLKKMNERKRVWKKVPSIFSKVFSIYLFFQHNQCYVTHYGLTVCCLRWL